MRRAEIINKRIYASAQASQARGHQVSNIRRVVRRAGQSHVVRQQNDVGGSEARGEQGKHRGCHGDGARPPRLVLPAECAQGLNYANVTHCGAHERDEEEQGAEDRKEVKVVASEVFEVHHVMTRGDAQFGQMHGVFGREQRCDPTDGKKPHGGAHG